MAAPATQDIRRKHHVSTGQIVAFVFGIVVVVGIFAFAIPKFANTKSKAYKTAMISDLRNLVTAEEAFFSDSGRYSATLDSAHVKFAPSTNVTVKVADPQTATPIVYAPEMIPRRSSMSISRPARV